MNVFLNGFRLGLCLGVLVGYGNEFIKYNNSLDREIVVDMSEITTIFLTEEKMMSSIPKRIMQRVRGYGRDGRVYTPRDFLDLGSRAAVDQTLSRLAVSGQLRRLGRGLYDYPRVNHVLDRPVPPRVDAVAAAVAGRRAKIMPDGISSANALGLTNAVPAKASFITDGYTGTVRVGGRTVYLKRAPSKLLLWLGRPGGPVVQALGWLGSAAAHDPRVVAILRTRLPNDVKSDLRSGIGHAPSWVQDVLRQVVAADPVAADPVAA